MIRRIPPFPSPVWNAALYRGGSAEYVRLEQAVALNRAAALSSASWGMFQVLGSNYRASGCATVDSYVDLMVQGEGQQLTAFARFVINSGMAAALRDRDWDQFARRYNGPAYRTLGYSTKLQAAYLRAIGSDQPAATILFMGAIGPQVKVLQASLALRLGADLPADGVFGAATEAALRRFQAANGLAPDGIAGAATLAALNIVQEPS